MGVRARATVASPALCARKEVQLGSGAIHEFRGVSQRGGVPVCACCLCFASLAPVCALLMRVTLSRLCVCARAAIYRCVHGAHRTVCDKYPARSRFSEKSRTRFSPSEFVAKLPRARVLYTRCCATLAYADARGRIRASKGREPNFDFRNEEREREENFRPLRACGFPATDDREHPPRRVA